MFGGSKAPPYEIMQRYLIFVKEFDFAKDYSSTAAASPQNFASEVTSQGKAQSIHRCGGVVKTVEKFEKNREIRENKSEKKS